MGAYHLNLNNNKLKYFFLDWELLNIGEYQFQSIYELNKRLLNSCIMDISWSKTDGKININSAVNCNALKF